MSYIKDALVWLFEQVHNLVLHITPDKGYSYGLSIILFTFIIKLLLVPLNIKQMKSQSKMQELQPLMQELQKKYKNDPQKQQAEVMKLYKEHNANPLGGCLPLFIQMPVLIAMYSIVYGLSGLAGAKFLWLPDLSQSDPLFILPVLSGITTYLSGRLMMPKDDSPQAKTTSTMNVTMGVVFAFMSLRFKSALVLYWVASNVFQLGQTYIFKKIGIIGKSIKKDTAESSKDVVKEISTDKITTNKKKKK